MGIDVSKDIGSKIVPPKLPDDVNHYWEFTLKSGGYLN